MNQVINFLSLSTVLCIKEITAKYNFYHLGVFTVFTYQPSVDDCFQTGLQLVTSLSLGQIRFSWGCGCYLPSTQPPPPQPTSICC